MGENLGLAAAVGLASFLAVDRRVARERRPFVQAVEEMLKSMRLKGLEEQQLRQFVCRYSGTRLGGVLRGALRLRRQARRPRARWADDEKGLPRKRFAAWRDPLVRFIEGRLALRQARREAAQLHSAERRPASHPRSPASAEAATP